MITPKKHLVNNEMLTVREASEKYGIKYVTLKKRMAKKGVVLQEAIKPTKYELCKAGLKTLRVLHPKEYQAWVNMKRRCNPNTKDQYNLIHYSGRGITVSQEFESSFETFLTYVGICPHPTYSLDRINNNEGYKRGNLRWASKSTQAKNTRSCKSYQPIINNLKKLLGYDIEVKKPIPAIPTASNLQKIREYKIWAKIKGRCFNKKDTAFLNYGGRGITMHEDFQRSFYLFLSHVGQPPDNSYSLDRINNNGDYTYVNLRWVKIDVQLNNKRTATHSEKIIEDLKHQCDEKGISYEGVLE